MSHIELNADDIVISYWGIGPVFRNALKKNLAQYLIDFKEPFKFTILTDCVEEFKYIREQTDKCLAILDINEQRKNYEWSYGLEVIPEAKTDKEYTLQFRENLKQGKKFSYSLHRFVIPWMIENKVTTFMMVDPDVQLQLKNKDIQTIQSFTDVFFTHHQIQNRKFTPTEDYVVGSAYFINDDPVYFYFFDTLKEKTGLEAERPSKFPVNDGPFRFYRFKDVETLQKFFDIWNDGVQLSITDPNCLGAHGSVFVNDEALLGAIYALMDVKVSPVNHIAVWIRHRIENRYMMPTTGYYKLADTYEEFLEINREELIAHYKDCNWPDIIEELYGEQ